MKDAFAGSFLFQIRPLRMSLSMNMISYHDTTTHVKLTTDACGSYPSSNATSYGSGDVPAGSVPSVQNCRIPLS